MTRLHSTALGCLPDEGLTTGELGWLIGVSNGMTTSVAGRLIGSGTDVREQEALRRRPVRPVATGRKVQLASDRRRRPGGYVAAFVDSDGADEGCGHHSAGYARTRLAHGLGLEPARCRSANRWRSTNGP